MAPIQHELNLPKSKCLEFGILEWNKRQFIKKLLSEHPFKIRNCINKFSQLKITFITIILQTILTFVYTLSSDTYQNGFNIDFY